jgi:hypothetical protein
MAQAIFAAGFLLCTGASQAEINMLLESKNPKPKVLPTLGVWQSPDGKQTFLSSSFPDAPAFTCDTWCYESDVDFVDAKELSGGKVQMRHRWRAHPAVMIVTSVTPEPGAVEFVARLENDRDASKDIPTEYPGLNACWQLKRAPAFSSAPDPYPEFIKRCFIFTDAGVTFLDRTDRKKIPVRRAEDPYNNPPWVQMYLPVWQPLMQAGPDAWADYSSDRYIYPVIGAVSRDGKYLTAIANESNSGMAQAWHDCMHNNPDWLPLDAGKSAGTWRLKIYLMKNDARGLIERIAKDFPGAMKLKDKRVPASPP